MSPEDTYLTRRAAAEYLKRIGCATTWRTLERLAVNNNAGRGPAFIKTGARTIRYRQSDLDKWAAKRAVRVE